MSTNATILFVLVSGLLTYLLTICVNSCCGSVISAMTLWQ